jgi:HAE1 family hydrophobic/amphiphilic exporter-1
MEMMEDQQQQLFAFAMAIILVFLLMGMLFESLSLPLSIITAVPFAMFGAYWMLLITGTAFDLMAGIGIVIMVGIVVNNAIVLVDLVQLNRSSGMDRNEALISAGRQRFRPILMTAATTIVGLIPMAVGNASLAGIPYKALGRVVIGGLITSSLMTLLLVPLLYTFIDDIRGWFGKIAGFALAKEDKS